MESPFALLRRYSVVKVGAEPRAHICAPFLHPGLADPGCVLWLQLQRPRDLAEKLHCSLCYLELVCVSGQELDNVQR